MVLELTPDESGRLDDLLSLTCRGKKPSLSRPDKITVYQIRKKESQKSSFCWCIYDRYTETHTTI